MAWPSTDLCEGSIIGDGRLSQAFAIIWRMAGFYDIGVDHRYGGLYRLSSPETFARRRRAGDSGATGIQLMTIAKSATKIRNRQVRRGISWNAVNLIVNKGTSLLLRLFLARILMPADFGLVGLLIVFLGFVKIFGDLGLEKALIQRLRDSNSALRYDSAFWLLAGLGVALALGFYFVAAPLMVWFYDEPLFSGPAKAMAISIALHNVSIVPSVRLVRLMRFRSIVIAEMVGMIGGSIVAVTMAFAGFGIWSLVAQQILSVGLKTAVLWRFCRWRPRWRFSRVILKDLANFSAYMMGNQVVFFTRMNVDYIVVGALLGTTALGVYTLAFAITETLRSSIGSVLVKVLLPAYSVMQRDRIALLHEFLFGTRLMTIVLIPVSLLLIFYVEPLIELVGPEWRDAVTPARILSVCGLFYAVSGPSAEVLQAVGRADTLFKITAFNLMVVVLPAMLVLTRGFGPQGAATAVVIGFFTVRVAVLMALRREIGLSYAMLFKAIFPATIAGVCVAVTWWHLNGIVSGLVLALAIPIVFGTVWYYYVFSYERNT